MTSSDRRQNERARLPAFGVFSWANKYIDGTPHTVEILDVSAGGLRIRNISEPSFAERETAFPIELMVAGLRLWAWCKRVWRRGDREALEIVFADPIDRARFRHAIATRPLAI